MTHINGKTCCSAGLTSLPQTSAKEDADVTAWKPGELEVWAQGAAEPKKKKGLRCVLGTRSPTANGIHSMKRKRLHVLVIAHGSAWEKESQTGKA